MRLARLLWVALSLYSFACQAGEVPEAASARIIDERGVVTPVRWPVQISTDWDRRRDLEKLGGPAEVPRASVRFRVPQPESITPYPEFESKFPAAAGDSYLGTERGSSYLFPVTYRKSASSAPQRVNLLFLPTEKMEVLVHESCQKAGVTLQAPIGVKVTGLSTLNFAALLCSTESDRVSLIWITSADVEVARDNSGKPSAQGVRWTRHEIDQPNLRFAMNRKQDGRKIALTATFAQPPVAAPEPLPKQKPWRFAASLGLVGYRYGERALNGETLSEFALLGKTSATFHAVPDKVDLSANAFLTLIPLLTTATFPAVRFYGVNGRAGYLFPTAPDSTFRFSAHLGWYFWGMLVGADPVPGRTFGISSMSGPQLFLTLEEKRGTSPPGWWAYMKYAVVAANASQLKATNREIALGGGYTLTAPWSLTLDIAQIHHADDLHWMSLLSGTLAIQRAL